jgi:mRNA-degrading endonuclease RelE of RelBE toxin-antitoxin system
MDVKRSYVSGKTRLRVYEYRVLMKILDPERVEVTGD